jgi:hypothetical protein
VTQTYYTKDIDGEYSVAQPQPTLREMEPEDIDDTMSVAERAVRIVLAKAKGVCLSKVHAIDHAGNSYLREASATQCANAIGALNIQPLIDQVHGILSLPTQPEPPADVVRDAARYRWLRNPTTDPALVIDKRVGPSFWDYEYRAGDALDAAIDAAIEREILGGNE